MSLTMNFYFVCMCIYIYIFVYTQRHRHGRSEKKSEKFLLLVRLFGDDISVCVCIYIYVCVYVCFTNYAGDWASISRVIPKNKKNGTIQGKVQCPPLHLGIVGIEK